MEDEFEEFQEEFETENDNMGGYSDYFDCYNDDLDPDQQGPEFWNQF